MRGGLNRGSLVHDVTVQYRPSPDAVDVTGAPLEGWQLLLADVPMSREAERAGTGEQLRDAQESAMQITRWTMPYHEDMDPDRVDVPSLRRLVYQGRAFDILDAQAIDRQVGILLRTLSASKVAA